MEQSDTRMIQEIYLDDPWKLLVGCIMLNQTSNKQVRPVIKKFFEKWPDPISVIQAKDDEMIEILRPLGFYNRRTRSIKDFSIDWICKKGWKKASELKGIGKYGEDSYEIFVNKNRKVNPTDKVLIRYLNEHR